MKGEKGDKGDPGAQGVKGERGLPGLPPPIGESTTQSSLKLLLLSVADPVFDLSRGGGEKIIESVEG